MSVMTRDGGHSAQRAIADLPVSLQTTLAVVLERIMGSLADTRRKRPFGTCPTCCYLEECVCRAPQEGDYLCAFVGQPLDESELDEICINYEPGGAASRKR